MLNRTRSFSTSSRISMEKLGNSLAAQVPVHRRSASDPVALRRKPYFLNTGVEDNFFQEGDLESFKGDNQNNHFSFSIEVSENFSCPSANNPSCGSETRILVPADSSRTTEPLKLRVPNYNCRMEPKRIRRMLANRVSSQRCRLRKLEYVNKLKKEINKEEARLSVLSPQISLYETQCKLLEIKNYEMKEKVEALENEKASKEAEFQALMEERIALGLAYNLLQEGK